MGVFLSRGFSSLTEGFKVPLLILVMLLILVGNECVRVSTEILRVNISNRFRLALQGRIIEALVWEGGERRLKRDPGSTSVVYSQDAGALGSFMLFGVTGFLEHLIRIGIYSFGMCQLASGRGWILVAIFLPLAMLSHILVQVVFQKKEHCAISASETAMMSHQSDALRFFDLIDKLVYLRGEKRIAQKLLGQSKIASDANASFQRISSIKGSVAGILATLSVPLVFLLAFWLKIGSPGEIIQIQMIVTLLMGSVGGLMSFPAMVNQYAEPVGRVLDVLETPAPGDAPRELQGLGKAKPPSLSLENIVFSYPGQARPALQGVNFDLASGESVCLVANSGGGKSTLARILVGDWQPSGGRILMDGQDVTKTMLWHRRSMVGYLPAEQGFLKASLADNLVFGRDSISERTLRQAVAIACLEEKLDELGDEPIHDVSRQLSTGERRRVGVARLLCGDEPIWIFDEPTSGLDPSTARKLAEGILEAGEGRSTIIITHDPQLFPGLDVLFLSEGLICDRGMHEELLVRNAAYREVLDEAREGDRTIPGGGERQADIQA